MSDSKAQIRNWHNYTSILEIKSLELSLSKDYPRLEQMEYLLTLSPVSDIWYRLLNTDTMTLLKSSIRAREQRIQFLRERLIIC